MIYFLALIPATALTIAGYFVLFLSNRSEGAFRTFGKYLGFWAFALAALVVLGAIFAAAHGGHHCPMIGARDVRPYARSWERIRRHPERSQSTSSGWRSESRSSAGSRITFAAETIVKRRPVRRRKRIGRNATSNQGLRRRAPGRRPTPALPGNSRCKSLYDSQRHGRARRSDSPRHNEPVALKLRAALRLKKLPDTLRRRAECSDR